MNMHADPFRDAVRRRATEIISDPELRQLAVTYVRWITQRDDALAGSANRCSVARAADKAYDSSVSDLLTYALHCSISVPPQKK